MGWTGGPAQAVFCGSHRASRPCSITLPTMGEEGGTGERGREGWEGGRDGMGGENKMRKVDG